MFSSIIGGPSIPSANAETDKKKPLTERKERVLRVGDVRSSSKLMSNLRVPAQIQTVPVVRSHTFRFEAASAAVDVPITVGGILGIAGCIGTISNSTGVLVASSFRLKRIRSWAAAGVAGGALNHVYWTNSSASGNTPDLIEEAFTLGSAGASELNTVPPKGTLAAFWWNVNSASTVLFNITLAANGIVDVEMEYTQSGALKATQTGFTSITVGGYNYLYLDGVGSGPVFKPIGLPTTL